GAVVDTLGGTPGRENVWNSDRRLADIWANNQRQNTGVLSYDQTNHPGVSTGAEITGALTSGFAIPFGAGARTVPQLAKVGAAWGGTGAFLSTDGSVVDRAKNVPLGATVGAIADPLLGKALQAAAPVVGRAWRGLRGEGGAAPQGATSRSAEQYAREGGEWPGTPLEGEALERATAGTMAMDAEASPSVSLDGPRQPDYLDTGAQGPRRLLDPATEAERLAAAQNIQPRDVLPMPGNLVEGPQEAAEIAAGRFAPATVPNERTVLNKRTVTNYMGVEVPKVGPVDMVGWLRTQGGLREEGGELSTIGIDNNAARKGLDHIGQEMRFGPILNNDRGMTLDDAALASWEAGYFPELPDRPDVNTFLDALAETYNGGAGRRFRPEDAPEIDAYEATQAERFDLEQQQIAEGGPIWADRSTPGDSAEPFAPPQAYEEWPSEAIGRVGNVDVSKLDTPQDIRRALKSSRDAVGGFDAATRGRITQAETERLASELNMTPESLLSRRKGQAFNAEEALAARQMLAKSGNELVNAARRIQQLDDPGDEALAAFRQTWMRHVAIQEQVSGMTAEAGRALAQFRQAASSRAIRGDVLSALARSGGGRDGLKDAADVLLETVEMGPGKFNALAREAMKPKWRNKVSEFYINFLLSNPPTHIVNMASNTATSMLQIPEYAAASAVGGVRRFLAGENAKPRILASEVGARAFGLVQGTKEGAHLFAKALRSGEPDDFVSKVEGDEFKAIDGLKGEVIRFPTRLLTAEDQFFKGVARRMAVNGLAARKAAREGLKGEALDQRIAELSANPTDEIVRQAQEYGLELTFQNRTGEIGQSVSRITNSSLLAKIVVPFVRTPINLMKFAAQRSPVAPFMKDWRAEVRAGGERRDLAIAKALLGTGFATVMYQAALEGHVTGAVPSDPQKARLLYADGWQPYSIKVGDRYISYSRMDPLSTTIGVAADMATLPEGLSDRQRENQATMFVASIMGNLASKTWLSGASAFTEALSDPARSAGNWLERTVSSFAVPAGVAGVARAIDPVSRQRDGVMDAIQARVPGLTDNLMARRDIFGEVIENDSFGPDFLSPFWQSREKSDPVVAELLRIEKGVSAPGKQFSEDGEKIDYTPEQYDRYHEIAGRLTYNGLLSLIGSDRYGQMSDDARRKAATKAIRDARKSARTVLADPDYPLPAKGAEAAVADSGSDWPGEPRGSNDQPAPAAEQWPGEPMAQRDVMGSLQRAIPGVNITSGYRSAEHQADMRRRGYKPAANSRHLDGSALDLTPPPGKSMGWLAAQVRRVEPEASILNEGDHLHVVFKDWYAAPALGGAQRAGLSNRTTVG
ncbi:MAG: hypothetical protein KKE77_12795, partial [Alphaproteobacteria bacterium]|nr:hypothetical protein [Alphaproteobacteria bacterium]